MIEITSGLLKDPQKDKLLIEKMKEYKEHEYSVEITRACGRILSDLLLENMKDKFYDSAINIILQ